MPDYAPTYTPRLRLTYASQGATHRMMVRMPRNFLVADLGNYQNKLIQVLNTLTTWRYTDWTQLGWDLALVDSPIFLPVAYFGSTALAAGTKALPASDAGFYIPFHITFVARTAQGGRVALFVYGVALAGLGAGESGDWRVTSAEDAVVANAVGALATNPLSTGNDDAPVVAWKPYVDFGYAARWVRRERRG